MIIGGGGGWEGSLRHNVLCFSFVVVLYYIYSLYAIIKEIVMCNNNLRLKKSTHEVNRPLEFIEAP